MFEALADGSVQAHEVGGRDALAIGRIGDDDGLFLRLGELLEVLLLE